MAQWVKAAATEAADLTLFPRIYMVRKNQQFVVSSDLHTCNLA